MNEFIRPIASFSSVPMEQVNECLIRWGHKMGPDRRQFPSSGHGLFVGEDLVAVTSTGCLMVPETAGVRRENAIELIRLCSSGPAWSRVILRLWRELVFPSYGVRWAISYQHATMHTGNIYRFDGWKIIGKSRSGTDKRSGRRGYSKNIWGWEVAA